MLVHLLVHMFVHTGVHALVDTYSHAFSRTSSHVWARAHTVDSFDHTSVDAKHELDSQGSDGRLEDRKIVTVRLSTSKKCDSKVQHKVFARLSTPIEREVVTTNTYSDPNFSISFIENTRQQHCCYSLELDPHLSPSRLEQNSHRKGSDANLTHLH